MGLIDLPKSIDKAGYLRALDKRLCEESLAEFVKRSWHAVEPLQPYKHGWHIDFICEHLEAITAGEIVDGEPYNRLLINVPPGTMKSLLVNVFWPAWEWGPKNMPGLRYVCASHSLALAIRDSMRMRRLIASDWYVRHWGDRVIIRDDQNAKGKFETTQAGWREAIAAESITGARGDRVIIDDALSVDDANSDTVREGVNQWFREAVPTRLNNPDTSAIIVIMQRLHESDLSGLILDNDMKYDHVMLPMRYDPDRAAPTRLGLMDIRTTADELLFPARFPLAVVVRDETIMGPFATAGQFQQSPTPRGGGVIKDAWWQLWTEPTFPPVDFIVASLDTAYGLKEENDYSALTVWGVFTGDPGVRATRMVDRYGRPKEAYQGAASTMLDAVPHVILMSAWMERLPVHELIVRVAASCKDLKVDRLLIENKASGISVAQEMRRLFGFEPWAVHLIDPKSIDKLSRLYSVQHLFAESMIYAPDRDWAEMVIRQCSTFPKGKHDDLVDTVSQALKHMRECGLLTRSIERLAEIDRAVQFDNVRTPPPLYDA
jgi:predicted phage terminase large subunit-like protein